MRPIAVSSDARVTRFPKLPTIGKPSRLRIHLVDGYFRAGRQPRPIVDKLNAEVKKAVADPGVASNLSVPIARSDVHDPEDRQTLKADYDKYEHVFKLRVRAID